MLTVLLVLMVTIKYFNLKTLDSSQVENLYLNCPEKFKREVSRFRLEEDRLHRLIAREIVQSQVQNSGINLSIDSWLRSSRGKPFLKNGPFFNISHSGNYVVVAFNQSAEIGVDIEHKAELAIEPLTDFLHPTEIAYIKNTVNDTEAFYHVWTRKEAYLKALGTGIIEGISHTSVLNDVLINKGISWTLKAFEIDAEYSATVCYQSQNQNELAIEKYSLINRR